MEFLTVRRVSICFVIALAGIFLFHILLGKRVRDPSIDVKPHKKRSVAQRSPTLQSASSPAKNSPPPQVNSTNEGTSKFCLSNFPARNFLLPSQAREELGFSDAEWTQLQSRLSPLFTKLYALEEAHAKFISDEVKGDYYFIPTYLGGDKLLSEFHDAISSLFPDSRGDALTKSINCGSFISSFGMHTEEIYIQSHEHNGFELNLLTKIVSNPASGGVGEWASQVSNAEVTQRYPWFAEKK